nr:unnamed protein product [Spirometra erinaceieuropaei]
MEPRMIRNTITGKSDWQHLVYSPKTNSFELSLVVDVANGGRGIGRSSNRRIPSRHIHPRLPRQQTYTFAEMAEIEDKNWRVPIPRSVFMLYPQALDIKQVVANITNYRPITEAPIFNQTIRFLKVSSTVCVPGKPVDRNLDAIVIVKSAVYNFADRNRLRSAFGKEKQREPEFRMAMVFSVGLPRSSGGRFFQRDGFNISLPDRAGEAMEEMQTKRTEVLRNLTEEARINGDLVVGDYEDTYYNLSLKLFHTYQWASCFCRPHFTSQQRPPVLIFLDDDFAFNARRMKVELGALTDAQIRRVIWGLPRNHSPAVRHSDSKRWEKWSVSKREMPWPYYPHLAPGCFTVIGADVLQEIALAMYFTLQFPLDDAWLGMVMTKLDLQFQFHPRMYNKWPRGVRKNSVLFAPLDYLLTSK